MKKRPRVHDAFIALFVTFHFPWHVHEFHFCDTASDKQSLFPELSCSFKSYRLTTLKQTF